MSPLCWRRDQCKPKRRLPPELVVRRPGVSPPPLKLPSNRWRDLTCPTVALAKADPPRLACCPPALSISLSGDFNSSFILHPSSFILSAAARLRSWRWGKTARKPAKLVCCRPPPALAEWDRNERERKAILLHPRSAKYKRARQKPNSYVQPSTFDVLAGASPASAMDDWAE
jgi:hypothetical protein